MKNEREEGREGKEHRYTGGAEARRPDGSQRGYLLDYAAADKTT